jgi:cytochrome c-type biogenesis protein CcmH
MTAFIAAAAALTLLAIGAVVFGPRLQRRRDGAVCQARSNAAVLRQQFSEIEDERARGLLDEAEFARRREELQRRLLAETADEPVSVHHATRSRLPVLLYAAVLPIAAALLYTHFGHPQLLGAPPTAQPLPAAADSKQSEDQLLSRLEAHLVGAPEDARAWVMLARLRMQRDQFEPAAIAYQRAIEVSAKVARDPMIWCEYADALGMAQGGRLAGKPREMIDKALALDAAHPRALEMAGSSAYEAGDFRDAARYWQQLLAQMPEQTAEHAQLAAAITRAEQRAKFRLPAS